MCGAPLSSIPLAALVLPASHFTSPSPQSVVKEKRNPKYGVTKNHQKSLIWKETCKNDECPKKKRWGVSIRCPSKEVSRRWAQESCEGEDDGFCSSSGAPVLPATLLSEFNKERTRGGYVVGGTGELPCGWAKLSPAGGSWVTFWPVPGSRRLVQLPGQAPPGLSCGVTACFHGSICFVWWEWSCPVSHVKDALNMISLCTVCVTWSLGPYMWKTYKIWNL